MTDPFDVSAETILITGASQGLGRQFARVLSAHGAAVVLAARQTAKLKSLEDEIRGKGGRAAAVQMDVLRNTAGVVTHALVQYSVNFRFPGETTFTGLHIHDGIAGVNGPVRLDSGLSGANNVPTTTGFGNIFRVFNANNDLALAAANGVLTNPEAWYLNLHTTVNPGGVVRSQIAPSVPSRTTSGPSPKGSSMAKKGPTVCDGVVPI